MLWVETIKPTMINLGKYLGFLSYDLENAWEMVEYEYGFHCQTIRLKFGLFNKVAKRSMILFVSWNCFNVVEILFQMALIYFHLLGILWVLLDVVDFQGPCGEKPSEQFEDRPLLMWYESSKFQQICREGCIMEFFRDDYYCCSPDLLLETRAFSPNIVSYFGPCQFSILICIPGMQHHINHSLSCP